STLSSCIVVRWMRRYASLECAPASEGHAAPAAEMQHLPVDVSVERVALEPHPLEARVDEQPVAEPREEDPLEEELDARVHARTCMTVEHGLAQDRVAAPYMGCDPE